MIFMVDEFLELGVTGINRFGNDVAEEWLRDLSGKKGIKVYKEMRDNDPVIGAILFAIKSFCRSVTWRVEPAGGEPDQLDDAELIRSCMYDMSHTWQALISQILSEMLPMGRSYHEIVYKRRLGPDQKDGSKRSKYADGKIGWRKLPVRSATTCEGWRWGPDGSLQGMIQQAPPDYKTSFIPIEKALLFRTDEDLDNPEGRSVLRNAYSPWHYKVNIERFEAIGIEKDAVGIAVAWVPPKVAAPPANDPDRAALIQARDTFRNLVKGLKRHTKDGILMPLSYDKDGQKVYDLTLLQGASRQVGPNASETIQRHETRMMQSVLAEFMMLGVQKAGGSYALSQDKTDYFSMAVTGYLDEIAEVMSYHAIPRLMALNGRRSGDYPTIVHSEVKRVDPSKLATVIQALSGAGMPLFPSPDGSLENWILSELGMPEINFEEAGEGNGEE